MPPFRVVPFPRRPARPFQSDTTMYIFFLAFLALANGEEFSTLFSWSQLKFEFPDKNLEGELIKSGYYIPENNMPTGLNNCGDKMFVAVARWKNGVASTLNYFWMNDTETSPTLMPYPDWESNDIRKPGAFVSVFRVRIDSYGRMWGVDTGVDGDNVIHPMTLFAIDLNTGEMVVNYPLKASDLKTNSFIADLVVDDAEGPDDVYVYMSDFADYGVIVYSHAKNDSWRIEHNFFHFDPLHGDYNISGVDFQWTDGVFGMSLSAPLEDKSRTFYFHPMSGITEFSVNTTVLKDQTLALSSNYFAFHVVGKKGNNTQGPSSVIDQETGIDYFTQPLRNGIACWDTNVDLNPSTFKMIEENDETMRFTNDIVISSDRQHLLVLANSLVNFDHNTLRSNRKNYVITGAELKGLTAKCRDM